MAAPIRQMDLRNGHVANVISAPVARREGRVRVIEPAHKDDIHGLVRISPLRFVTGSKDRSVRVWSVQGALERSSETSRIDYTKWVTALAPTHQQDEFLVGTRDGYVAYMNHRLEVLKEGRYQSGAPLKGSKERNQNRINCVKSGGQDEIFIGMGCGFTRYNFSSQKSSQCITSDRDWVYCMHLKAQDAVFVVTGTEFEFWQECETKWSRVAVIQTQKHTPRLPQRPFISAMSQLSSSPSLFGVSVFDGSIRVHDVEAIREVWRSVEHKGRTWAVENINPSVFASCGDDKTVRFWDLRQPSSVLILQDFPGRVSGLLSLGEGCLITASCPDDPHKPGPKAELGFWDIRALRPFEDPEEDRFQGLALKQRTGAPPQGDKRSFGESKTGTD
jgi:WD40 repeat protein